MMVAGDRGRDDGPGSRKTQATFWPLQKQHGLGKSMVIFRLFEKLTHLSERSAKLTSLYQEQKYLEEKMAK